MPKAWMLWPLVLVVACAAPEQGRLKSLQTSVELARDHGAYRCAPYELAMAESHTAFAEQDPPRHLVRLCFGKKDETIDAGVAAMAKAKEIVA